MPLSPRVPDLVALDLLLSVVELGSLSQAAKMHGVTQPAASSRIRYLEKLIGVPVLMRTPNGSLPTPSGSEIVEQARAVINAAHRLDDGITMLLGRRNSRLRVAASQTVAEYLFPQWLPALRAQMPEAAVTLDAGSSAQVRESVLAGRAEIGFVEGPHAPKGLESKTVARDRLVVVVSPQHAWARRNAISVEELADAALIQRESGSGTRTAFECALAALVPGWVSAPLLQLSSTTALKNSAVRGVGPAVLSSLAVKEEIAAGTLRPVIVTNFEAKRFLRAVWPKGQRPAGPARALFAVAQRTRDATPQS
ncbi:LysR family transcriptional regulator [Streptomyces anulatus]|uniref:LysR family transcriptional regulator n=1 Tax=Streptomyces sp. or20 TaxID=1828016 RepID=UPI000BEFD9BA|nr:LysR family transcriptional regulator [Streptomyces sp. or20]